MTEVKQREIAAETAAKKAIQKAKLDARDKRIKEEAKQRNIIIQQKKER
jgi:hypothetical protein